MDKIVLYSSDVELSENQSNPDSYFAKFIICDFTRNHNGVALKRDTIDTWISTLKNKPLVGKITLQSNGEYDFSGHNVKRVKKVDEQGNEYDDIEFDTSAFGSFIDVGIETIDNTEYIVATAEIWKRFTKACDIIVSRIKDGTLHTSWEISIEDSEIGVLNGLKTKFINAGRFIGHCLLAKNVAPAYDSSGLLEIASTEYADNEFYNALSQDILEDIDKNKEKECENLDNKVIAETVDTKEVDVDIEIETPVEDVAEKIVIEDSETDSTETVTETTSETSVDDVDSANSAETTTAETESTTENTISETSEQSDVSETKVAELTTGDMWRRLDKEIDKLDYRGYISYIFPTESYALMHPYNADELSFIKLNYNIENDNIMIVSTEEIKLVVSIANINAEISAKNDEILSANEKIKTLEAQIAELNEYKVKFEQSETEKAEKALSEKREALKSYAVESGYISMEEIENSEEIKTMIENVDEAGIKNLIVDRLMTEKSNCKKKDKAEISEKKEKEIVTSNIADDDTAIDYKTIMKNYLKR